MSTAFKSCNIVLFPSAVVEHQAMEWSRSVSRRFKTRYVLDAQTWHPHMGVTLILTIDALSMLA